MSMTWRAKRQFIGVSIVVFVIVAIIAYWAVGYFSTEPTCFDGEKNGDELGIDCGGSCQLLCAFESRQLIVNWQRVFRVTDGVYSVAAYIENQNTGSGVYEIPYEFRLYDEDDLIVAETTGKTFVGPNDRFAVVEPTLATGNRVPVRAFFRFLDQPTWQKIDDIYNQRLLRVQSQKIENEQTRPRVTAVIKNTTLEPIYDIEATAIIYYSAGNAMATGLTVIQQIPSDSTQEIFFTWPEPFEQDVARIEIVSRINVFNQ